jgi:hypothetical protein
MTSAPVLARFGKVPLGLVVESLPPDPAKTRWTTREFRYRLRPTRPGSALLPPVAVSAFDPESARYFTKVTSSLPIRVEELPKFDPSTLDYPSRPAPEAPPRSAFAARPVALACIGIGVVMLVLTGLLAWTWLVRRIRDPGRVLLRRARLLKIGQGPERTARLIQEILAEYLERTTGRPRGVLTPEEARIKVTLATQQPELGERCERLVADCDWARYSGNSSRRVELMAEAWEIFEEIGRQRRC